MRESGAIGEADPVGGFGDRDLLQIAERALKDRIEASEFRPVIDRHYPLAVIAEAYLYVQTGEKAGIVVIDVEAEA